MDFTGGVLIFTRSEFHLVFQHRYMTAVGWIFLAFFLFCLPIGSLW